MTQAKRFKVIKMKVKANYNITLDEGSFIKGKEYNYKINNEGKYLVTTEEGMEQDLNFAEFDIFFTLLKN